MNSPQPMLAQHTCENILKEGIRDNLERNILPSENAIALRLLSNMIELQDAYQELYSKLGSHPYALKVFLDTLLSTTAFWNPAEIQHSRTARNDLVAINQQIAATATKLAELMKKREHLHNTSSFSNNTYYHVCDVIEAASQQNFHFRTYLKEKLDALHNQFDLKYWPSLGECIQVLASDAAEADTTALDPVTAAATATTRPSKADFFRALFSSIEENRNETYGLPLEFKLSDRTTAALGNCVLDLGPEELVDDVYIKNLRSRERENSKKDF